MASRAQGAAPGAIELALEELISTFNELNSSAVEELDSEPSPLEFMRFVARNTPFVVRQGASSWKARREWNSSYLRSALQGQTINVAVTPYGYAFALPQGCSYSGANSVSLETPIHPPSPKNTTRLFLRNLMKSLSLSTNFSLTSRGKRLIQTFPRLPR